MSPREELLAEVQKYTHHANYDGRFGTVSVAVLLRALRALEVLVEEVCPIEDSKAIRALAILRGTG